MDEMIGDIACKNQGKNFLKKYPVQWLVEITEKV